MAQMTMESDVERRDWLAREFERNRSHLRAVGYRMLGSMTEAEDAVQEAWVRLDRRDPGGSDDLRGWLTVTVGRICLDMLRTRRARRETYAGTWLPEPIVTRPPADTRDHDSPEQDAVLADSVGLALLVVLETLAPVERLAFVMHDVFRDVVRRDRGIVDRTPAAAASLRAGRDGGFGGGAVARRGLAVQRRVVDAFLAASRNGDFEALLRVLDPDVVFRTDGGGRGPLARPALAGRDAVARQLVRFGPRFAGTPVRRSSTARLGPSSRTPRVSRSSSSLHDSRRPNRRDRPERRSGQDGEGRPRPRVTAIPANR